MIRDKKLFVNDIVENVKKIEHFSKNLSKDELKNNELKQYAIIRAVEIIGEAVKNIPIDFIERYPEIPWSKIAGMRDLITHSYFKIDLDYVWEVIRRDIPDLKQKILKVKEDLEEQDRINKKSRRK